MGQSNALRPRRNPPTGFVAGSNVERPSLHILRQIWQSGECPGVFLLSLRGPSGRRPLPAGASGGGPQRSRMVLGAKRSTLFAVKNVSGFPVTGNGLGGGEKLAAGRQSVPSTATGPGPTCEAIPRRYPAVSDRQSVLEPIAPLPTRPASIVPDGRNPTTRIAPPRDG